MRIFDQTNLANSDAKAAARAKADCTFSLWLIVWQQQVTVSHVKGHLTDQPTGQTCQIVSIHFFKIGCCQHNFVMELLTFLWIFLLLSLVVGFALFLLYADADLTLLFYHSLNSPRDFRNKVVWITGASSGIGEYLAYALVKSGAKLALSGVNVERLTAVGERCKEISKCAAEDILLVPFQINDFEVHDECVKKVLDHFGQIDILVNNAGISQRADFADIDIAVDQQLFNVNVFGTVNLTRKVLIHFLERKKGHVVVTSSTAGKLGAPYSSTYTGSKHALHGYFECLRSEMVEENIDVTLVCPGPVFSNLTERCVTGKVGEKYGYKQQPTDKKMTTERCCDLMATAIAYKLDECWICIQPILFMYYMAQYCPTVFRKLVVKLIFNRQRVMKLRQGR